MDYRIEKTIKEPFWSAGQKYGWEGERTGIGLKISFFQGLADEDYLVIPINISKEKKFYKIQKRKARELVNKYNSYFMAKNNTKLAILPLQEFEEIK